MTKKLEFQMNADQLTQSHIDQLKSYLGTVQAGMSMSTFLSEMHAILTDPKDKIPTAKKSSKKMTADKITAILESTKPKRKSIKSELQ